MANPQSPVEREESAAVFPPSADRRPAVTSREWSYVDAWLARRFSRRLVPPFERNPSTLKVLLALADTNAASTEEDELLGLADHDALQAMHQGSSSPATQMVPVRFRDSTLRAIEKGLSNEGRSALESLAAALAVAGTGLTEPEVVAQSSVEAMAAIYTAEQMADRTTTLERHIHHEVGHVRSLLSLLRGDSCTPRADLQKQNLELQNAVEAISHRTPESANAPTGKFCSGVPILSNTSIHDVVREEQDYIALLQQKKDLESRIASFRGLPSDPRLARDELDALQRELHGITSQRDAAFQGLVDRTSPIRKK
ncbi:hypothetical protein K4F52_008244 [Lecanicillium sp. MT-2017a]|nr:hypothetical protein K4F52_008244 [Lecanicillium sp. MT-2017a]